MTYTLKHKSLCNYELDLFGEHKHVMYKYISSILPHSMFDNSTNKLIINSGLIYNLDDYMNIYGNLTLDNAIIMICHLNEQLLYLHKNNLGYYGFNLSDILVVDNDHFILCDTSRLSNVSNNILSINNALLSCTFSNPELKEITTLPSSIPFSSIYYNIGCLFLYTLVKINKSYIPPCFEGTKLEWFLKRCFRDNSKERMLLLI